MKLPRISKQSYRIAIPAMLFGLLVGIGGTWWHYSRVPGATFNPVRLSNPSYSFIAALLYTEVPESLSFPAYSPLKQTLTDYRNSVLASGAADSVAVYVRDMNTGHWIGINQTEKFSPASMLKVVALITYYHEAESFPPFLTGQISIPRGIPTDNSQDFFPPSDPVASGHTYSANELLIRMITNSDNIAASAISAYLGDPAIKQTFTDLHLPLPSSDTEDLDSVQQYSHLFRVLYNGTYLSQDDSEKALKLLSQTTYTGGLVAGVPAGTQVSHKFGERTVITTSSTNATNTSSRELHDCGIVYYPGHPYFICVMTKGSDFTKLQGIIKDISQQVWAGEAALYKGT